MRIVFVCGGNTCRSPMLAYMFADYLKRLDRSEGVKIVSRGLSVSEKEIKRETAEILASNGIKFENHVPAELSADDAKKADFIIAVNDSIKNDIERSFLIRGKLISVLALTGKDVFDPYGMGLEAYETVFEIFNTALPLIYNQIFENQAI